jgi:hypothetical protein
MCVTVVPSPLAPSPKLQLVPPSGDHPPSGETEKESDCPAVPDRGIETLLSNGPTS